MFDWPAMIEKKNISTGRWILKKMRNKQGVYEAG
jgi:hypothetical protein